MKKIIYGESNFKKIKINNDYFYIDKTKQIERLEKLNESFVIFLRPRRFGKSLFLSTLQYYYDENSSHEAIEFSFLSLVESIQTVEWRLSMRGLKIILN